MILIQEKLVSNELIDEKFVCDLAACKGACCWEGDAGAPLDEAELGILEEEYSKIRPFLTPAGKAALDLQGPYVPENIEGGWATTLIEDGPCAYIVWDENGVAGCGIEKAWAAGATDFRKPISCHLYPIRVQKNDATGFEALNYDEWSICSAACENGKKLKVPVYQFLKDAIKRAYGADFYEELDGVAEAMREGREVV